MSISTGIQWCDDTVNPTMGCDGCELWRPERGVKICYAGVLHRRHGGRNPGYAPTFSRVSLFPGRVAEIARAPDLTGRTRLLKPWLCGHPRMIFVSDMSDALSKVVPFPFLEAEIIVPATSPEGRRHRWLWLTKRAERMARFSAWLAEHGIRWPANVWIGTSITTPNLDRVDHLLRVGDQNTVRFLSVEPQSSSIALASCVAQLDWVIQGGASGIGARPFDVAWARTMRDQCATAQVPYFLKQLGRQPVDGSRAIRVLDPHGGDWAAWPADLRVRQVPRGAGKAVSASGRFVRAPDGTSAAELQGLSDGGEDE